IGRADQRRARQRDDRARDRGRPGDAGYPRADNGRRQAGARSTQGAAMTSTFSLILKRAAASRNSGWREDDYDVAVYGIVVGRIMKATAAPDGTPWFWTLAHGHRGHRTLTHGYEATREAAMTAFAKSWRQAPAARGLISSTTFIADGCRPRTDEVSDHHGRA